MSQNPSPTPDKLWDVLPQIVGRLRNEFLLFTFGFIILVIAVGAFAPGIVTLLGRELFYLLVVLAFIAYVSLRVMDVWSKSKQSTPATPSVPTAQPVESKPDSPKPTSARPQKPAPTSAQPKPAPPSVSRPIDPTTAATQGVLSRKQLLEIIDQNFSEDELRELCYNELQIDYENLSGEGKRGKGRELIAYCERRVLVTKLVEAIRRARPDIALG